MVGNADLFWNSDTVKLDVFLFKPTNFKDLWEEVVNGTTIPLIYC